MSRYPTIDQPTAPLDGTGLPYQRLDAPLAAFGGNDAAALGRLGDTLQQGVQDYRDRLRQQRLLAHESAANDALTQHRMTAVGLLRQYTGTRLQDAVDGYPAFAQALQGSRDAVLQDLSAPAQALLKPHLQRAVADALQVGLEHQQQQDHAWSDQSSLGALEADMQEAVLHRNDPARVQALADRGLDEWLKIGERKGWSDRDIGAHAARSRAALFDAVIGQHLADGNVEGARVLLGQARGQLDPATWRQMAQAVQAHSDAATGAAKPDAGDASNPPTPIRLAQAQPIDAGSGQPVLSDAGGDITAGDPQVAQLPDGAKLDGEVGQNTPSGNVNRNADGKPPPTAIGKKLQSPSLTPEQIWQRDKAYLDKYLYPATRIANEYGVNPEFILALGIESNYASSRLYKQTKDAFGMTNGGLTNMTTANDAEDNLKKLFALYGNQIRGTGNDRKAFINAMLGKDAKGNPVKGWLNYNPDHTKDWLKMMGSSFPQMRSAVARYMNEPGH